MKNFTIIFLFCISLATFALDRNFCIKGDGKLTPQKLEVFRRGKNYIFSLKSSQPAIVTIKKANKVLLKLSTQQNQHQVIKENDITSWVIPDSIIKVTDNDLLDVTTQFLTSNYTLPHSSSFPLQISGRKGLDYSWNDEQNTIVEQIDNNCIVFNDSQYDVLKKSCNDLIAGKAEVKGKFLYITCKTRTSYALPVRIMLNSIDNCGYSNDGVDFMVENKKIFSFNGKNINHWKWQQLKEVIYFTHKNNQYYWKIPLSLIQTKDSSRLKIRFSTLCNAKICGHSTGDVMPDNGKILPVLRPGNLANLSDTKITVSSIFPQYKIYPLIDGQVAKRSYWAYAAFAAGNDKQEKFVAFNFAKKQEVKKVIIYWEAIPKEFYLQILDKNNNWQNVPVKFQLKGSKQSLENDNETGVIVNQVSIKLNKNEEKSFLLLPPNTITKGIRLLEKGKNGVLWIREVEIY